MNFKFKKKIVVSSLILALIISLIYYFMFPDLYQRGIIGSPEGSLRAINSLGIMIIVVFFIVTYMLFFVIAYII